MESYNQEAIEQLRISESKVIPAEGTSHYLIDLKVLQ